MNPASGDETPLNDPQDGKHVHPLSNRRRIHISTFTSFSSPNFVFLWLGTTLMIASHQMMFVAQGYMVYKITESATILGIVGAGGAFPMLILAPIAGTVADKFKRKNIVLICQSASVLLAAIITILILTDLIKWQYFLVTGICQGAVWAFNAPARQAWLPQIVSRDKLHNSISLISAGMSAAGIIAPAIAGIIYSFKGPGAVYMIVTCSASIAVLTTVLIRKTKYKPTNPNTSMLGEMIDGCKYMLREKNVRLLFILGALFTLLWSPIQSLLPVLVVDVYQKDSTSLGVLSSMLGMGALIGNFIVASLPRKKRGLMLISLAFISGSALLGISLLQIFVIGLILLLIQGFGSGSQYPILQILVMEKVDEEYRGRAMGFIMMIWGLMPLAVFPTGIAVDIWGPTRVIAILGLGLLLSGSIIMLTQKWLRDMD
ncbi:MAG: MFS transporter [SAR202 cluster bacterium]|nr:MFS transporter [SAR202 cluster bacterium]|tara:strand:+ start:35193 stop:36482 length:1290 start_codon:yes stop_codon:yes gene_type:complete